MYLISIDPGSRKFGYAVFEINSEKLVDQGTIFLDKSDGTGIDITRNVRFARAQKAMEELLGRYPGMITEACFEEAFLGKNVNSTMVLSMARGVLMAPLFARMIPITDYPTKTAKTTALGTGSASKEDGIYLMKLEYSSSGLVDQLSEDAADAMIVGKAHLIISKANRKRSNTSSSKGATTMQQYRKGCSNNIIASRSKKGGTSSRGSRDAWTKQFAQ